MRHRASDSLIMSQVTLPILLDPAVSERTSAATRRVLEERARPVVDAPRFFSTDLYAMLQQVVHAVLPQGATGTHVDIAAAIDKRLADGKGSGWRFADLPADGEAYVRGLTVLTALLKQTPMKLFERMSSPAQEEYLRRVAYGDVDEPAGFALSKWLLMVKTDAVKAWLSHPAAMEMIGYYGFADGATGMTHGPTVAEGWQAITPNEALPLEMQHVSEPASQHVRRVMPRDGSGVVL